MSKIRPKTCPSCGKRFRSPYDVHGIYKKEICPECAKRIFQNGLHMSLVDPLNMSPDEHDA